MVHRQIPYNNVVFLLAFTEKLQNWFADMAKQVHNLNFEDLILAGPRIIQLIQALEEVWNDKYRFTVLTSLEIWWEVTQNAQDT